MGPIGHPEASVGSYCSTLRTIPKERRPSLVGREKCSQGLQRVKYMAFVQMFIITDLRHPFFLGGGVSRLKLCSRSTYDLLTTDKVFVTFNFPNDLAFETCELSRIPNRAVERNFYRGLLKCFVTNFVLISLQLMTVFNFKVFWP